MTIQTGQSAGQRMYCYDFMHTGVQMKYVSKLTDARRASRGR